jgi:putative ABC transport system ATP-binding protein
VTQKPWIRLVQVTRTFQVGERAFHALRGVSLEVAQGEFVAILGPSGSGKSTLLNLIAGIDKPTAGEVWVGETRVDLLDEDTLARWRGGTVGIVFQFFQLLPTLTVLENVALPQQLRELWRPPDLARAEELLHWVGLWEQRDKLPGELSGGEKQRVALARALVNDPPLLIADEPTGNLDLATGAKIVALIAEQHRRGKTVVLVTHEERLAAAASRRVHLLDGCLANSPLPTISGKDCSGEHAP